MNHLFDLLKGIAFWLMLCVFAVLIMIAMVPMAVAGYLSERIKS